VLKSHCVESKLTSGLMSLAVDWEIRCPPRLAVEETLSSFVWFVEQL